MSEFGGLWKHEKIQQALEGLGSAALAAAVALPRYGGPNFPKGIIKCIKYLKNIHIYKTVSCIGTLRNGRRRLLPNPRFEHATSEF